MGKIFTGQRKIVRSLRKRYCEVAELVGVRRILVRACGAYFLVDRSDQIQAAIAAHASWEPDSLNRLAQLAARHRFDYFVDVGANIGFYAIVLAKHRLADRVIAIEPLPGNYLALLRHIAINRLRNVDAFQFALGDSNRVIEITEGPRGNRSNGMIDPEHSGATEYEFKAACGVDALSARPRHAVNEVRFDDQFRLRSKSILFKLDIECTELAALRAMTRTLRENDCCLQVEAIDRRVKEVTDLLAAQGYAHIGFQGDDHYFTNIANLTR